jgi:hypothetical protein
MNKRIIYDDLINVQIRRKNINSALKKHTNVLNKKINILNEKLEAGKDMSKKTGMLTVENLGAVYFEKVTLTGAQYEGLINRAISDQKEILSLQTKVTLMDRELKQIYEKIDSVIRTFDKNGIVTTLEKAVLCLLPEGYNAT